MQSQPRFGPIRRVLLPYTGEEPLSRKQGFRVVVVWALLFTAPMVLCTVSVSLLAAAPLWKLVALVLGVFLLGIIIFGLTAWFVVSMMNRSARIFQQRASHNSSTSGGRYGS